MSLGETHYVDLFGARHRVVKIAVADPQVRDLGIFFLWDRDVRSRAILARVEANCFLIAESMPEIGDSAHRIGYPWNNRGNWRRVDGTFLATRLIGVKFEFSEPGISGECGAPYFNTKKEVIGIHWGSAEGTACLTDLDQIKSFLQESIGGIPNCNKSIAPPPPREDSPTPGVQPVDPSPGIEALRKQIATLEKHWRNFVMTSMNFQNKWVRGVIRVYKEQMELMDSKGQMELMELMDSKEIPVQSER